MSSFKNFILWLNKRLVRLYPAAYQEEFADEMLDVFTQTVSETAEQGNTKLIPIILREIRDYPVNLIREHWLNLTRKEPVMVTNSPSISANLCPRCATLKPDEARYCLNCGRAFIPIHVSMLEKLKHIVDAKLFFVVCCLAIMAILVPAASEMIINTLFHPVSLIIFSIFVAGLCMVLGWRLARKKSNVMRVLIVALISVSMGLTFIGLRAFDRANLRSVVNEGKTLTYNFLGMDTFIAKLESNEFYSTPCITRDADCVEENILIDPNLGRITVEMPDPEFISSVCEDQNQSFSCMIRHMSVFSDTGKPKILVERSWNLSEPAYQVMFISYVIGLTLIAFRITRKNTRNRLAAG
jgi:hypothetical protein